MGLQSPALLPRRRPHWQSGVAFLERGASETLRSWCGRERTRGYRTLPAEESVGGIVLDGPFDLAVGQGVKPLEEQGPQVDPQPEFSAEPPFALGRGAFQIGQDHIGEGLPRNDLGSLDQRMGGEDVNGHRMHTAGGVEPGETDAHGDAFAFAEVVVVWAADDEGIIFPKQLQPLSAVVCGLSQFRASDRLYLIQFQVDFVNFEAIFWS